MEHRQDVLLAGCEALRQESKMGLADYSIGIWSFLVPLRIIRLGVAMREIRYYKSIILI